MTSDDLTREQATELRETLGSYMRYLARLQRRMEKRGFPPKDRVYQLVCEAHDKLFGICVHLHYISCESGVGKEPKKKD